ncbi:hypothetical protein [Longispora albida]|uniref:hypothetical protein n=1 Tax=Longispora albida TaxID=203523 RepID=UPI0003A442D7|nr:hypothetical protein [Longispora albida]
MNRRARKPLILLVLAAAVALTAGVTGTLAVLTAGEPGEARMAPAAASAVATPEVTTPAPSPSESPSPSPTPAPSPSPSPESVPSPVPEAPRKTTPVPPRPPKTLATLKQPQPQPAGCSTTGQVTFRPGDTFGVVTASVAINTGPPYQLCPGAQVRVYWATYTIDTAGVKHLYASGASALSHQQPQVTMTMNIPGGSQCDRLWFYGEGNGAIPSTYTGSGESFRPPGVRGGFFPNHYDGCPNRS